MPRITGTTDRQSSFLRELIKHQGNLPPHAWPSPLVLRRWLRRETFRKAMDSLRNSLEYLADLYLAHAASTAATELRPDPQSKTKNSKSKISLLKLSHLRQRFAPQPVPPPPPDPAKYISAEQRFLRKINQHMPVGEALAFFDLRSAPLPPIKMPDKQEAKP